MTLYQRMLCAALAIGLNPAWALPQEQAAPPTSNLSGEWLLEILLGELQILQGDPGAGYSLLLDAARKSGDEGLYERSVDVALRSRAGDAALRAASAWRQAAPESIKANRRVLQIQIALQKIKEAQYSIRQAVTLSPEQDRSSVILSFPGLLERANDKPLAAQVLTEALEPWSNDARWGPLVWSAIGQTRFQAGDVGAALDAARRGHTQDPLRPEPVWVGQELAATSDEALSWVEQIMPQMREPALVLNWSKLLIRKGRLSQAEQVLLERTRWASDDPSPWLLLGAVRQDMKNNEGAKQALQRYLKESATIPQLRHERDQALMGLAQMSLEEKNDAEAEKLLSQVSDPENLLKARLLRASILAGKGQIDQGRTLITTMTVKTQKQELARTMTEVQYLRQFKQWQAAYEVLSNAANQFEDDDEIRYEYALAAEKIGKIDEMESVLLDIIEQNPKFHQALNALGYSWADRNIRLEEAKKLILQAIELAPEDPFIADSLGWVEFRMGRLTEARKILQSAFDVRPDAEIAAHLGEVVWVLGERDQALMIWRRGLKQDADNETLRETLQRLGAKP